MPRSRAMYFPAGAGQPVVRRGTLAGVLRVADAGSSEKMRNAPGVHVPVVMAAYFQVSLMFGMRSASSGLGDAGWLRSASDTRCRLHVSRYPQQTAIALFMSGRKR